jgi:hypothetical protein
MRKLLSGGLVFAGLVSVPAAVSVGQHTVSARPETHRADTRVEILRDFFERTDCPVAGMAHVFLEAADDYGLDWRLLPSLSFIESGGGRVANNNNIFGWNNGRASFNSVAASIHRVGYQLTYGQYYRDKDLDGILCAYNPRAGYAAKVKSVMNQISPAE